MIKFDGEGHLMQKIEIIISDNSIDNHTKQAAIENLCLEYDLNWFSNEIKDSLEARSVILHDIYKGIDSGIKFITLPYTKNNWFNFGKLILNAELDNIEINNRRS